MLIKTTNPSAAAAAKYGCLGRQRQQRERKMLGLAKEFTVETSWEQVAWGGAPSKAIVLSSTFFPEGQLEMSRFSF